MEWIELLNLLSQQQTDATTQRQIEALRAGVEQVRTENLILSLCMVVILASAFIGFLLLDRDRSRRLADLERSISVFNSMNRTKSDVVG